MVGVSERGAYLPAEIGNVFVGVELVACQYADHGVVLCVLECVCDE
jgi:hypothetical protein